MKHIPDDVRGAVTGFVVRLSKGLLDDERWDWDVDQSDWRQYQAGFCDPTVLRTTLAVFLNNLEVDDGGAIVNYREARFRAFQYFRSQIDSTYLLAQVTPSFRPTELEEPDWRAWEA